MADAEFGSRRRQFALAAASAVSVVAVVAVVAVVGHPWRTTAKGRPAAVATVPPSSSDSPLASPATSLPAVEISEPVLSAAPATSPPATDGPSTAPTTAAPTSHRTPTTVPRVATDSQINFKVNVQVSPTRVVEGQPVHVKVTIANAGGVFDGPVEMFFQGRDPSDNVSDPPPTCTAQGAIVCPITGVRPGRTWSFAFTFIPGAFPGTDGFDEPVYAAFNYVDSHGGQQQTPAYYAHLTLFNPPGSPPPASGAPSNTPPPAVPSASAASTSATSTTSSAG